MTYTRDPAEQGSVMRRLYRDWRPTRLARVLNRASAWYSAAGPPPRRMVALDAGGRKTGRPHPTVLVMPEYGGSEYLVSMLGERSG